MILDLNHPWVLKMKPAWLKLSPHFDLGKRINQPWPPPGAGWNHRSKAWLMGKITQNLLFCDDGWWFAWSLQIWKQSVLDGVGWLDIVTIVSGLSCLNLPNGLSLSQISSNLQSLSVTNGNNHQKAATHDQQKGEILHSMLTYPNMAYCEYLNVKLTYSAVYTCQLQAIAGRPYYWMLVSNLPKTFHIVTDHLFHHTQSRAIKFIENSRKMVSIESHCLFHFSITPESQ